MEQVVQRDGGLLIPRSVQGQALSILIWWKVSLDTARGWDEIDFQI